MSEVFTLLTGAICLRPRESLHELSPVSRVPFDFTTMPDQTAIARADVVIAGGGFAGLALALALRQSLGPAFQVVVADPAFAANARPDLRASAIAAAAQRMFEAIGVWDAVAASAQPILDMVVTDSRLKDAVRPVFLTFAGEVEPGQPFAHMIENAPLNAALAQKARDIMEQKTHGRRRLCRHAGHKHLYNIGA